MKQEVLDHRAKALSEVGSFFDRAIVRIEAIKPGEKIPATQLAEDLAKEENPELTGPQVYPTLKILLEDYPGVDVRRGAHGGIYRLLPGEVKGQKKAPKDTAPVAPATDDKK